MQIGNDRRENNSESAVVRCGGGSVIKFSMDLLPTQMARRDGR
jgi:hypothetical protein